jgi:chromosome partitioning protein
MATQPLYPPVSLDEISQLADRVSGVVQQIRTAMLAPTAKKAPPVFNTAQLADLVDLDKGKIPYRLRKGDLPEGTLSETGNRRQWSLAETRTWVREFRKDLLRPAGAAAVTVAVANFKGGVTKTTTAATLAQGLSLRGHRVLVIDTDPQGSLTTLFGFLPDVEINENETILPLCGGDQEDVRYAIRPTYWDGIDLIPATPLLFSAEFMLPARQSKNGAGFQFWRVLDLGLDAVRDEYDVIVIDTPPSLSFTTINALMAADGIVMPLPPNALDFASSAQFWKLFTDLCESLGAHGTAKEFAFIDVLPARVDPQDKVSVAVLEWIGRAYGSKVLPLEIPKTSTAATASVEFGTVYDLEPGAAQPKTLKRAIDAYDSFVDKVESQIRTVWAQHVEAAG